MKNQTQFPEINALFWRIRAAMVAQEYDLVRDSMTELTRLLNEWSRVSPPPFELEEISRQCLEIQSEIARHSVLLRDALRVSIESSMARRAYAIGGMTESRVVNRYPNAKE